MSLPYGNTYQYSLPYTLGGTLDDLLAKAKGAGTAAVVSNLPPQAMQVAQSIGLLPSSSPAPGAVPTQQVYAPQYTSAPSGSFPWLWVGLGGAVVLGIGGYFVFRKKRAIAS